MILEKDYIKITNIEHRKKYGQFFTPEPIAEIMCEWILQDENFTSLLEPAFGLGIFSRIILNKKPNIQITGFDVDKKIFQIAKNNFSSYKNIKLHLEDYLYNDWDNKYDRIICNPPYFKFHNYDNLKTINEIKKRLNLNLTGFTNIYSLFLIKSVYQLKENGRLAYIVPSEFFNSDYGKTIKEYLVKANVLRHIIIFDFKQNIFNDALTTSSILFMAKDNLKTDIHFTVISKLNELNKIRTIIAKYPKSRGKYSISINIINPNIKWRKYYQNQSRKYKYLIPFKQVAKVMRGIATGDNDYFTFNIEKAKKFNISQQNLLPCIVSSKDVKKPFFTQSDFINLKKQNAKIFIFDATRYKDKHTLNYLKLGEQKGVHKKYLTSRRNPWYAIENRAPSPIWVSVFNRNNLKFVRNEARIRNLTTFHCIYPSDNLFNKIDIDLLFAYLLTDTAKEIFNENRREYGNGLKKFEPNDLNNAMMLDLSKLKPDIKKQILNLYYDYRDSVLKGNEDKSKIQLIDKILKEIYEIKD